MAEFIERIAYLATVIKQISRVPCIQSMAEEILLITEMAQAEERNRWSNVKTDER